MKVNRIKYPPNAVLELTYRCNHGCIFCSCPWYAPESSYPIGKELSVGQWISVINKLYDIGVTHFSLSGGEAILKDGFKDILAYIRSKGNSLGIYNPIILISNARAMTRELLLFFKENNVHLSMSLPGYTTFERHTGVDNADGVLEWFRTAKEVGLNATANITVTKLNYHELFETISLALLNGAHDILLNRFLPGGRGLKYHETLMLKHEQINGMLETAEEVLSLARRYGNVGTEIPLCAIKNLKSLKHVGVGYKCAAAKGFFVIDPAGNIRTCNHSPHIVGNVQASPMIIDLDYWNLFAESKYKPNYCNSCKSLAKCDCGCREVANILTGSPCSIDTSAIGFVE